MNDAFMLLLGDRIVTSAAYHAMCRVPFTRTSLVVDIVISVTAAAAAAAAALSSNYSTGPYAAHLSSGS